MRILPLLFAIASFAPAVAAAQDAPPPSETAVARDGAQADEPAPARPRRVRRDRWRNTLSVGGSAGAYSPLGLAGVFVEYRPIRWVSANVGGGAGAAFGPAVATALYVDPIVTRSWSLGVAGTYSHNFSYARGTVIEGRPELPASTDWAGVEVQTQYRAVGWFIRLGVGYSWLLNTQSFRIANQEELSRVNMPQLPFLSPLDAVRAAAEDRTLGTFYVHIDIAPVWRL